MVPWRRGRWVARHHLGGRNATAISQDFLTHLAEPTPFPPVRPGAFGASRLVVKASVLALVALKGLVGWESLA